MSPSDPCTVVQCIVEGTREIGMHSGVLPWISTNMEVRPTYGVRGTSQCTSHHIPPQQRNLAPVDMFGTSFKTFQIARSVQGPKIIDHVDEI